MLCHVKCPLVKKGSVHFALNIWERNNKRSQNISAQFLFEEEDIVSTCQLFPLMRDENKGPFETCCCFQTFLVDVGRTDIFGRGYADVLLVNNWRNTGKACHTLIQFIR
ncbi:hypothetical protein NL108_003447 [Boleophthalmus pectinirostris]|nr:hypothetical protein NL108_003447 [Boleophthalmus pectinirostris]